jgi:hypothetical protein
MKYLKYSFVFALIFAFLFVAVSAQEEAGGVKGKVRTVRGNGLAALSLVPD